MDFPGTLKKYLVAVRQRGFASKTVTMWERPNPEPEGTDRLGHVFGGLALGVVVAVPAIVLSSGELPENPLLIPAAALIVGFWGGRRSAAWATREPETARIQAVPPGGPDAEAHL